MLRLGMELNGWLLAYVHKALDLFQGKKEERGGRSEGGWEEGRGGKKKAEKGRIHTAYGFNLGSYLNKKSYFTHILQIKAIVLLPSR